MCTFFETFCAVCWTDVFAIPSDGTDIRKSIGLLPCSSQVFCTFGKVLQHLWIRPIEEIFVILELVNLFQLFLVKRLSIVMHLIGLPFCWVFVTKGDQAAVVLTMLTSHNGFLNVVEQINCCKQPVLLLMQK